MSTWVLADEGTLGGVRYVTVLDLEGNPLEYNLSIEDAVEQYGPPSLSYDEWSEEN